MNIQTNTFKRSLIALVLTIGLLLVENAFAAGTHLSLGTIASNLTFSIDGLAGLITSACYIVGFGFGVGAILKFKGHRDNPSQVTIGQPISLAFIALAFVFMPLFFMVSGDTLFNGHVIAGGASGVATF